MTDCQRSFLRSDVPKVAVRIFFCAAEEWYGPVKLRMQNEMEPGEEVADLGNVRDASRKAKICLLTYQLSRSLS